MGELDARRIECLITAAAGSLSSASLWFVATCVPEQKAAVRFDSDSAARIQAWTVAEVAQWPAPLGIGERLSEASPDKLVFGPQNAGCIASEPYCELHADGASLLAVQIGKLSAAADSQDAVWIVGEGAIAWLSVACARFAAAWASRASVLGPASLDLRVFSSASADEQRKVQLWNFASGVNAPARDARQIPRPSQGVVDLRACLSTDLTLIARALLLPLLAGFGQEESRHIDATGAINSANFVGHAAPIVAWARALGVAHR